MISKEKKYISDNFSFILLLLSIILFRLPPFYILPFDSVLFSTHLISRIVNLIALIIFYFVEKKTINLKFYTPLILLITFDFAMQSLSILYAFNISAYLNIYKNVITSIILFYSMLIVIKKPSQIVIVLYSLLGTTIINTVFSIYLRINLLNIFTLKSFLYKEYYQGVESHLLLRGKLFTDRYDECLISIYLYLASTQKKVFPRIIILFTIFLILIVSLLSGFRINLVLSLMSLFFGLIILYRQKFKLLMFSFTIAFIVVFFTLQIISGLNITRDAYTRFIDPESADIQSIDSRFDNWKKAVDIAHYYPLTGVGLGNFYDYANKYYDNYSDNYARNKQRQNFFKITDIDPHNVFLSRFAETGYLGLIGFIILITYLFVEDLKSYIYKKSQIKLCIIVSFWCMFLFALFNPATSYSYLVLLMLLRGLIATIKPL